MHNDNATELQKENNLLNRQLKVMRELDVIRDQLDEKDLRELLLECLKFLAHELNAMARFGVSSRLVASAASSYTSKVRKTATDVTGVASMHAARGVTPALTLVGTLDD